MPGTSGAGETDATPPAHRVRCPTCRSLTTWHGNPHRPFCSRTCRLIDLGRWLDERYRVEADDDVSDSDIPPRSDPDRRVP
ncbi:MAG: DNA gyrase inhibitor YacG [Candidatus Rokubacteria bacterium]|nr:DNA gyrase inhibitor YacG [Candidatus Rokubacteria bacterium]